MANSEKLLQQQKPRQTGASEPIGQAVVNVSLFDLTRKHAYKIANKHRRLGALHAALVAFATQHNVHGRVDEVLSQSKLERMAGQVAQWVQKHFAIEQGARHYFDTRKEKQQFDAMAHLLRQQHEAKSPVRKAPAKPRAVTKRPAKPATIPIAPTHIPKRFDRLLRAWGDDD